MRFDGVRVSFVDRYRDRRTFVVEEIGGSRQMQVSEWNSTIGGEMQEDDGRATMGEPTSVREESTEQAGRGLLTLARGLEAEAGA